MAQTTNPDSPADSPATDFEGLRQEGIRLLQRLAGATWTDHNDHDPGITILEQLCYALTDLGYRIDYDIPDLLASSGDPARDLYTPGQVLSSEPVTLKDIRKLALDVGGVRKRLDRAGRAGYPVLPLQRKAEAERRGRGPDRHQWRPPGHRAGRPQGALSGAHSQE